MGGLVVVSWRVPLLPKGSERPTSKTAVRHHVCNSLSQGWCSFCVSVLARQEQKGGHIYE